MTTTNTSTEEMKYAAKSAGDKLADTASQMKQSVGEKMSDAATQFKSRVSEYGRAAADRIEDTRMAAANGLDNTASALQASGDRMTGFAQSTADKLSSTAEYLRSHSARRMMGDLGTAVKNNPGPSLIAALAIGFLMGRAMRNAE